jgi:DNA mismatch repair ATPase MutS
MNFATFISDTKKTVFKNSYYACLKDGSPVKNTIKLKKNMIITGPNASGKTTILKSTLINTIFTQQFGCGFYESADVAPFSHIHCYLNIPDTSGRDSLFQAEARRCKEILDIIKENPNGTHFCAFDELYSGTNPDEAVISATAFMKYLIKNRNMSCILTTHYVKLCKKLSKNKNIINCNMKTVKNSNNTDTFEYTYILEEGISEVRGGLKVLKDMNYPKEILDNTK